MRDKEFKLAILIPLLAMVVLLFAAMMARGDDPAIAIRITHQSGAVEDLAVTRPATVPTTLPAEPRIFGVNLEALTDWERGYSLINVARESRRFGSATKPYDAAAVLGPDKWPIGEAAVFFCTEQTDIAGVYPFRFHGQAGLLQTSDKLQNVKYDQASNTTTGEINVTRAAGPIWLAWRQTQGIKDLDIFRPGYTNDEPIFTRELIDSLKSFNAIRFMDWRRTNNRPRATSGPFDERAKLTDPIWSDADGVPLELCFRLCNATGASYCYLNVPDGVNAQWLAGLRDLAARELKPGITLLLAYSNEISFNGAFTQFARNVDAAKAEVAAGDPRGLNYDHTTNYFYWAWARTAAEALAIADAIPQAKIIIESQLNNPAVAARQLAYCSKRLGGDDKVKSKIYALAGAPYANLGIDPADPTGKKRLAARVDLTVDDVIAGLSRNNPDVGTWSGEIAFRALANKYGIRSISYEIGTDFDQFDTSIEAKTAAQWDLRMGTMIERILSSHFSAGHDGCMYFTLSGRYSRWGYWPLVDDVRQRARAPKFQAADRVGRMILAAPTN